MISSLFPRTGMLWLIVGAAACTSVPEPPPAALRTMLAVPEQHIVHSFAVSPRDNLVAYSAEDERIGRRHIVVASIERGAEPHRELEGTEHGDVPFFSPDGRVLGYFARGEIWRTGIEGIALPSRVTSVGDAAAGATWTRDGRIIFGAGGGRGLLHVPASGGAATPLTTVNADEGEIEHGWPHEIEDGTVVFTVSERGRDPHLEIVSRDGKRTRLRVPVFGQAQYVSTGHLVYTYLGNLMAVRFDAATGRISGVPQAIAKGIHRASFSVSPSGTLLWLRATPDDAKSHIVRVAPDRQATLPAPAETYQTPRLSPNGSKLAVVVRPGVMTRELRVLDAAHPERILFTISGGDNHSPAWVDDVRLTFGSNRDGPQTIYLTTLPPHASEGQRLEASALFPSNASVARNPAGWTRPPRLLALYEIASPSDRNVLVYRMGGAVTAMAATPANERSPAISPDGTWLAYVSDISGRDEVYAVPLDRRSEVAQITSGGGSEPVWKADALFYRHGERLMRLEMQGTGPDLPGRTREVLIGYYEHDPGGNLPAYDVGRDGRSLIMLKSAARHRELRVVQNWGTELAVALP